MDVPKFYGSMSPEELMVDWLNEMEEYFKFEEIEDPDKVRFSKTQLKGHLSIWWREVQLEKGRRGKDEVTKWDKMVEKLKDNLFLWTMTWILSRGCKDWNKE